MSNNMTITFWGVRGSYPKPGPSTIYYGGNTACVEISVAGHTIILDAGTGIIELGKKLIAQSYQSSKPLLLTLFLSHMHHDHTQGFPFFVPARLPSTQLHIFGPDIYQRGPEEILTDTMLPPTFPLEFRQLNASKFVHSVRETNIVRLTSDRCPPTLHHVRDRQIAGDNVLIKMMHSYAHPGGILCYRIEWGELSVVYASDIEGYAETDQRLIDFAQGADLLIHDAQYTYEHYLGLKAGFPCTQGWGHSTPEMACDVAKAANVKQLALFHYEPDYDDQTIADIEAKARLIFPNTIAPYEGLTITLER
jgi:phosphoribosyl 1,2-cyclic phosphodiesterase